LIVGWAKAPLRRAHAFPQQQKDVGTLRFAQATKASGDVSLVRGLVHQAVELEPFVVGGEKGGHINSSTLVAVGDEWHR
jgi:hypothetical protein